MPSRLVLPIAIATFALSCLFWTGGFFDDHRRGDPITYEGYAERMLAGELPYREFYVEYPPGALPAFVAPELVSRAGGIDYQLAFKLLSALLWVLALVAGSAILRRLGASDVRRLAALLVMATAPLTLGVVFLNRYDTWPAVLVVAGVLALLARRELTTAIALAAAVVVKIFALAAAPVVALRIWRVAGKRRLAAAGAAFVGVGVLLAGPFVAAAPGGVGYSLYTQTSRQLHVESLAGSILLAFDQLGLYDARIGHGLAIDLFGPLPDVLAVVSSIVQAAAVAAVAWAYSRGRDSDYRLVAAVATAIVAFIVFGKVFSPQFLIWLLPLVPLLAGRRWRVTTGLLVITLVLTQLQLRGYGGLTVDDWAVWTLLARNLTLLALFVVLPADLLPARAGATALGLAPRARPPAGPRAGRGSYSGRRASR